MDIRHPAPVEAGLADKLRAATVAHRDAREVAAAAAKTWRELVAEAVDAGMPHAQVAELAGVSRSRVHAITVREYTRG